MGEDETSAGEGEADVDCDCFYFFVFNGFVNFVNGFLNRFVDLLNGFLNFPCFVNLLNVFVSLFNEGWIG